MSVSVPVEVIASIIKTLEDSLVQKQKQVVITDELKSDFCKTFLHSPWNRSSTEQKQLDWIANNTDAFTVLLKSEECSALYNAVYNGYKKVVSLLISSYGVDVNGFAENGFVPLYYAFIRNNIEIAKLLIDAGADVNIIVNGKPLIHYMYNNDDFVKLLIDAGAKINIVDKNGGTLIHYAVAIDNIGVVKLLIEAGIDVNIVDYMGHTPLYYAVYRVYKIDDNNEHITVKHINNEIVNLLIEAGAYREYTITVTPDETTSVPKISIVTK
jgi:ankyrin repeat protein